ncbi:MAG: 2-oxo acid dehydrogenase subunit E2 [Propionibacteriaceae bacterium]|nr:2-oxo acid dehydrogenase subunit E2 [Propionibacteriaceae bacterium]
MADVVVMPQLGNTVESCLVTAWRVAVGEHVSPTTVVADIETDKSAMEVPAGAEGTVLALLAQAGDEVRVKAPFLIIGQEGESIEGLAVPGVDRPDVASQDHHEAPVAHEAVDHDEPQDVGSQDTEDAIARHQAPASPGGPVSPRARREAEEAGVDVTQIRGTGPHGRILVSDVRAAIHARPAHVIEEPEAHAALNDAAQNDASTQAPPRTRGAEAEQTTAQGVPTGIGGRLTRADIHAATTTAGAASAPPAPEAAPVVPVAALTPVTVPSPTPVTVPATVAAASVPAATAGVTVSDDTDFPGPFTQTPLVGIRKLVAERMLASMANHAQLTFVASAEATALLGLRARLKASHESLGMNQVTVGDLVAFAAAKVVASFPSLNATVQDMTLRTYQAVHLGVAVDTDRGLLVPTIRNAGTMGLRDFSAESKALIALARAGHINPDLMAGATFTVTNLGAYGIESFTPILNSPQTAILGVNAIIPRPAVAPDGSVTVEQRISFSLTVDHAVVDGAEAARFLRALTTYISNIDVAIMAEGGMNAPL